MLFLSIKPINNNMKKFLLMLVILPMMLVGCGNKTTEDKIEAAFKEYVHRTFDNPNELKEIVEICIVDTFDTKAYKTICKGYKTMMDSLDLINEQFSKSFPERIKSLPKDKIARLRNSSVFKQVMRSYLEHIDPDEVLRKQLSGEYTISEIPKNITSFRDTVFYEYKVTYRKKDDDKVNLMSAFALCDTIGTNITIFPAKSVNNYPSAIKEFVTIFDEWILSAQRTLEYKTEECKYHTIIDGFIE